MDDVQAQLEELKRLLVNQKAEIAALKGSALDPSDLAELQEAARLAEVQQALAEEMRLAESRTFGALSKTHEAAQFGRALKEFKRKLAQRSERAEKHRKLAKAREYFLGADGAPRVPPAAGEEQEALVAAVALQDAVDRAMVAKRRCDVDLECTVVGGNDPDFRCDVYAAVSDETLLRADAPRKAVIKDAVAAALVNQESRAKKAEAATLAASLAQIGRGSYSGKPLAQGGGHGGGQGGQNSQGGGRSGHGGQGGRGGRGGQGDHGGAGRGGGGKGGQGRGRGGAAVPNVDAAVALQEQAAAPGPDEEEDDETEN